MNEFLALLTHDPQEAIEYYQLKRGVAPTVLLVRPDFDLVCDHELVVRSRRGAWGLILASHTADLPGDLPQQPPLLFRPHNTGLGHNLQVKAKGRPRIRDARCPHCQQSVRDYNALGWWWGWADGIEPPYWSGLRDFVIERDGAICAGCGKSFQAKSLNCHHIIPKEEGGPDSARNIQLLCRGCHPDTKPILNEDGRA